MAFKNLKINKNCILAKANKIKLNYPPAKAGGNSWKQFIQAILGSNSYRQFKKR